MSLVHLTALVYRNLSHNSTLFTPFMIALGSSSLSNVYPVESILSTVIIMTGFNMHQQASSLSFSPHNQLIAILASVALRPVFILLCKLFREMAM